MNVYHGHQFTINAVGIACDSLTVDPRITAFAEGAGASSVNTISGMKMSEPIIKGTTRDIKALIDQVTAAGYVVTGASTSKVIAYIAKEADGYGYTAGSTHKSITVNKGLVVIDSISARGTDAATASFTVYALFDGTNNPFVVASSVALPGTPAALSNIWVCGKANIDGTDYETQSIDLQIGPQVSLARKDGELYPRFVHIDKYDFKASIDTLDAAALELNGLCEDSILYFQKHSANTETRVAAATEEHISVTIATAYMQPKSASVPWPGQASFGVDLTPVYNGTDSTIAIDTTAAIA